MALAISRKLSYNARRKELLTMQLKQSVNYHIPFNGQKATCSAALMGLSVFLRFVYYFLPCDLGSLGVGVLILRVIIPLLLCGAFLVLLKLVRLRVPAVYGILAAAMCLAVFIGDIMAGGWLRILLSALVNLCTGAVLVITLSGILPKQVFAGLLLAVSFFLQLMFGAEGYGWIDQISGLSMLASLFFFVLCINPVPIDVPESNEISSGY